MEVENGDRELPPIATGGLIILAAHLDLFSIVSNNHVFSSLFLGVDLATVEQVSPSAGRSFDLLCDSCGGLIVVAAGTQDRCGGEPPHPPEIPLAVTCAGLGFRV